MRTKTIQTIAAPMRKVIGSHYRLISSAHYSAETYAECRRDSDEAAALAKYLIQHLQDRHDAKRFADAVGMPGYINMR